MDYGRHLAFGNGWTADSAGIECSLLLLVFLCVHCAGLFGRVCMCDCACLCVSECLSVSACSCLHLCLCAYHIIYMPTCLYVDVRPRLYSVCRPMCVWRACLTRLSASACSCVFLVYVGVGFFGVVILPSSPFSTYFPSFLTSYFHCHYCSRVLAHFWS